MMPSPGPFLLVVVGLAAVTLAVLAPVLFAAPALVLSHLSNDAASFFLPVHQFAAERMRAGDLPFYNPHTFAGLPFVGGFQSAIFYPPNLLFLALPVEAALNASFAFHLALAGAFCALAAHRRGAGAAGAMLAGLVFLLGGPFFLHLWAGHFSLICAVPWTILALVAADALLAGGGRRWIAIGAAGGGLALLAGHPQTVFHAVVAGALWIAFRWPEVRRHRGALGALGASVALGAGIAAIQLWPAIAEAPYGIRGGLTKDAAAMFSLPPESVVSLIAPAFFGADAGAPYWGRGYFWEMSLFVGAVALPLIVRGAFVPGRGPIAAAVAAVLLLLALGANGPLYPVLQPLPGFDRIRGWSKFTVPALFFLALLAADGLDRVRRSGSSLRAIAVTLVAAIVVAATGFALRRGAEAGESPPAFRSLVASAQAAATARGESYIAPELAEDPAFLSDAARRGGGGLLAAGMWMAAGALLTVVARRRPGAAAALLLVAAGGELALAARPFVTGFDPAPLRFEPLARLLHERGSEGRILNRVLPNSAMTIGAFEIAGYDPAVPRRTAEFLEFSQARSPDRPSQFPPIDAVPELFAVLRFELAVFLEEGRLKSLASTVPPLPRAMLVEHCEIIPDRDEAFVRLSMPDFDFRTRVIVEEEPMPAPVPGGAAGRVAVTEDRGDEIRVEASLPAPAILLMTDAYHPFWTAEALPGSAAHDYAVLPANRMLRAIPLAAGEHRIRMTYRVPYFTVAVLVSLASLALAAAVAFRHRPRPEAA